MSYQKTGVRALKGVILGQPCTRVVADGIRTAEVDAIIVLRESPRHSHRGGIARRA